MTSIAETVCVARVGRDGSDRADRHRCQDLDGLLGRGRRRLDVARGIGRDAVEAVAIAGLADKDGRGIGGRDRGELAEGPAILRHVEGERRDARRRAAV